MLNFKLIFNLELGPNQSIIYMYEIYQFFSNFWQILMQIFLDYVY